MSFCTRSNRPGPLSISEKEGSLQSSSPALFDGDTKGYFAFASLHSVNCGQDGL